MTEAALERAAPRCAVHPEVPAQLAPCERCGAFACDACFGLEDDGPIDAERLCAACRERTGRGTIAWEDRKLPFGTRLFSTVREALVSPVRTFEAIGRGELGPPLSFAVVTTVVGYAPLFLLFGLVMALVVAFGLDSLGDVPLAGPRSWAIGVLCAIPVVLPTFALALSLFADLYFAVVFHVAAIVLGGKGSFESSLRATLYTSAIRALLAPLGPFFFIPLLGGLLNLGFRTAVLIWCSVALYGTARRVHGLRDGAAMVAGAAPAVSVLVLFVGLLVLVLVLAFSGRLDGLG